MSLQPRGKFGALVPALDPRHDPRLLKLDLGHFDELAKAAPLPDLPAAKNFGDRVEDRDPLGNIDNGDCTVAALGHLITHLCVLNGIPSPVTAAEIVRIYYQLSGGVDSGLYLYDVLEYARTVGICGVKISGHATFDWTDRKLLATCSGAFGGVIVAAAMPSVIWEQDIWDVAPGSRNAGNHAIYRPGHSPGLGNYVSWGERHDATEAWERRQVYEAHVVYVRDLPAPSGLSTARLDELFARIR
jgi:hypothetical protein